MNDEIVMILKMVEDGKVSAERAKDLIDALKYTPTENKSISNDNYDNKLLKVDISSSQGDNVNLKLPVKLIKEIIKVADKLPLPSNISCMEDIDMNEIINSLDQCFENNLLGEIINISSSQGDLVKITIS